MELGEEEGGEGFAAYVGDCGVGGHWDGMRGVVVWRNGGGVGFVYDVYI